ncbi:MULTISPECIES: hypothetical protein [unclassified Pseudomonas]|uniref:hypothetical protein n=1 Tax=unclassified Pseudomonas TaxID=196821 RepID=UPI003208BADE
MPYAIREDGSFIMRSDVYQPEEGEALYDDVPQWAYDAQEALKLREKQMADEVEWQATEMSTIANQLTAIEDEDPAALPGTSKAWRDYRIKVRAWVDGAPAFPDSARRPVRPA